MPLSRHSVGTYPETSSHATCQGTFGHSRLSPLSHWNEWSNILSKSSQARKKATTTNSIFTISVVIYTLQAIHEISKYA